MKTRILPPEEWRRATGASLPELLFYAEPQNAAVIVVEDEAGGILASVCALRVMHFEGLWIRPEERGNAGVFRALIREAFNVPRLRKEHWVLGGAAKDDAVMMDICERLGGRQLPVEFYAMRVGE